ncbi:MAG: DNA topoisomerase, partial [Clostridia bacterium]|nr:DNA topoisomerase [Clostridia bacterium]
MKLIIAEKPSLARNISAAISDTMKKGQGYFEGGGYIVTWGFGHLFSLCSIETYNPAPEGAKGWTMANLPCFPRKYQFELRMGDNGKPDAGINRQFEIIKALCRRPDVDTIINAGDSDREGEIIVRIIIDHALTPEEKQQKQLKRLWMPDQTAETIRAALVSPPDEKEYDLLAYEGYARTFIDWLYGVNLT